MILNTNPCTNKNILLVLGTVFLTYNFKADYKEAIIKYTVVLLRHLSFLLLHADIYTEKET